MNTKTISTLSDGYKIENLTIAVVLNRKQLVASLGKDANQGAIDRQLKEVESLVGSAAGVDLKRGDRVTVAAVDFFRNGQPLDPVPSPDIVEILLRQAGSVLNAGAMLGATLLLIWFGLRPAIRAILEMPKPREIAGGGLAVENGTSSHSIAGPKPAGETEPNLIADLTSRLGRTPQKRLEQMVDLDEEQAAAILRQWIRGAGRA
jgi:flagellar M-ring protein FliF